MTPEVGTWLRAARICFFKNSKSPNWIDILIVWFVETMHVIGLTILAFIILPNLDVVKGVMLTNCVCLIPGILGMNNILKDYFK